MHHCFPHVQLGLLQNNYYATNEKVGDTTFSKELFNAGQIDGTEEKFQPGHIYTVVTMTNQC